MEDRKRSGKKTAYSILAIFLAALFFLSIYANLRANIRFSRLKYVEDTARYAADVTGDNAEYLTEGRLERAWKILKTSVREPKTYEDYDLYASIAIAREDFEGAAAYLKGCIDTCEGSSHDLAVLHLRLGSLYILQEDSEQALPELNKALELDKYLASAYYLRAQLYAENDEVDKALDDLREYRKLDTSDPEIVAAMGPAFEEAGDMESAVASYTAGIESKGDEEPHLYADRARCEVKLEDLAAARKDLETYFTLTDEDPDGEAAALLGACLMEAGEFAEAVPLFRRAVEDGYEGKALLYEQAMMCSYQTGNYEDAAEDGNKAIAEAEAAGEDKADLHFWTGMAYLALQQYDSAAERLGEAAEMDPDLADIWYYRGVAEMAQDHTDEAARWFTKSVEKNESRGASLYNRALCYLQKEDYEKALADLEQASKDKGDSEAASEAKELLKELEEALEAAQEQALEATQEEES